jgi:hypothetical protein
VRIDDALRPHVRFQKHNLRDELWPGRFDVILCRNVLIYFDPSSHEEALTRLHSSLRPAGYLLLGYAELLPVEEKRFEALRTNEAVIYRRVETESGRLNLSPPNPSSANLRVHVNVSSVLPPPLPLPFPAPTTSVLRLHGEYANAARLSAELKPLVTAGKGTLDLDGAAYLHDDCARVLKRARVAVPTLELRATRPAVLRWLARHGLK